MTDINFAQATTVNHFAKKLHEAEIAQMPAPAQPAALQQAIESGKGGATLENVRAARKASRNGGNGHATVRLPLTAAKSEDQADA